MYLFCQSISIPIIQCLTIFNSKISKRGRNSNIPHNVNVFFIIQVLPEIEFRTKRESLFNYNPTDSFLHCRSNCLLYSQTLSYQQSLIFFPFVIMMLSLNFDNNCLRSLRFSERERESLLIMKRVQRRVLQIYDLCSTFRSINMHTFS